MPRVECARQLQAELLGDEIIEIADDRSGDYVEKRDQNGEPTGSYLVDHENIQRSQLRVDTRKWYLSKVLPNVYGDRHIFQTQQEDDGELRGIRRYFSRSFRGCSKYGLGACVGSSW